MSLVFINGSKSTATSPFRFFTELAKTNPISDAIQSFRNELPNSYETNIFNRYAHTIGQDKLSFTVEYNVNDVGYADEFGNWITELSNDIILKEYTFRDELEKYFRLEYDNSCLLLVDKWDEKGFNKDSNRWFTNEIVKLLRCVRAFESKTEVASYRYELIKPYEALIAYMYERYPAYVPKANIDERISLILQQSENHELIYTPASLKTGVYRKVVELTDVTGEPIFDFTDVDITIKNLASFGAGAFDDIKEPIQFSKNIEAAYYFIRRLSEIQNIKTKDILKANIFLFNNRPFTISAYHKNVNSIRGNNSALRKLIDTTIESSLS